MAEEVAKVNLDLIVRDENGEIYTVRYDAVNTMLLNEFLKAHRKVQEQEIQKVSAEVETEQTCSANCSQQPVKQFRPGSATPAPVITV